MLRRTTAVLLVTACGLFPDVTPLGGDDASVDVTPLRDAAPDLGPLPEAAVDSGMTDAYADAPACTCTNLVSAYQFSDPMSLGHDTFGNNNFTTVYGSPQQSPVVPSGLSGHSMELDGSSSVCIATGFTFDSTSDHTLCWWSRPAALANSTNQFAQTCSYDTWTTTSGVDYLWRINNCNGGTAIDMTVPGVYAVGQWTQICQTYTKSTMTRVVVVNGQTSQKTTLVDTAPILEPSTEDWCIGSYAGGGYWDGLIYLPMWFDRVLSDAEIQQVYAKGCCLP